MFSIFSKKKDSFVYDQAVIVNIDFAAQKTPSLDEIFKEVKELERNIEGALPPNSGIDGDDLAEDEAIVYIYGPNADAIFKAVEPILKKSAFDHITITLQYGLPDDPATKDKKFTL